MSASSRSQSKMEAFKAKLRATKAAKLGMTLEQFDAHVEAENRRQAAITRAIYDRDHQFAVIAANANFFNRIFIKLR